MKGEESRQTSDLSNFEFEKEKQRDHVKRKTIFQSFLSGCASFRASNVS